MNFIYCVIWTWWLPRAFSSIHFWCSRVQLYKCSFSNARRKLTYFSKLILLLTSSRNYSNNIHEWTQLQHYFGFVCLILFCFVCFVFFCRVKTATPYSAPVKSQTFISGRFSNLSTRTKRAKFSCPGRLYIHLFTYNGFQHISALVYFDESTLQFIFSSNSKSGIEKCTVIGAQVVASYDTQNDTIAIVITL